MPALIELLRDQDEVVRYKAVGVLGHIAAEDAIPALIQLLQDQSSGVRFNTAWALRQIGTPEALEAVKEYEKSNW